MEDLNRIKQLAQDSDRPAALQLWTEAVRRDDLALKQIAAQAQGDPTLCAEVLVALLEREQRAEAYAFAAKLGIALKPKLLAALEQLLAQANDVRAERTLSLAQVLAVAFEARWRLPTGDVSMAFAHAGTKLGNTHRSATSACLAVYVLSAQTLTISVRLAVSSAPSPAIVWKEELRPWRKDFEKNTSLLVGWANSERVRRLADKDRVRLETTPMKTTPLANDDPVIKMDRIVDGQPSAKRFRDLVLALDDWYKQAPEAARAHLPHLCARLETSAWSHAVRVIELSKVKGLKISTFALGLYKHLDIGDVRPTVDLFIDPPAYPCRDQITYITASLYRKDELVNILSLCSHFPGLTHLVLRSGPLRYDVNDNGSWHYEGTPIFIDAFLHALSSYKLQVLDLSSFGFDCTHPEILDQVPFAILRPSDPAYIPNGSPPGWTRT